MDGDKDVLLGLDYPKHLWMEKGSVRSYGEKDQAGTAAWNAPGVNSVRNNLNVACA